MWGSPVNVSKELARRKGTVVAFIDDPYPITVNFGVAQPVGCTLEMLQSKSDKVRSWLYERLRSPSRTL